MNVQQPNPSPPTVSQIQKEYQNDIVINDFKYVENSSTKKPSRMVTFAGDAKNDVNENIEDPVQLKFYKTPRPKVAIKLQKSAVTIASITEEGPGSQTRTSQRSLRSRANTPRALKRIQDDDETLPKRKRGRRGRRSFHPSSKVELKVLHSKQRLRRRLPKCMFCSFTCKVMKDLIIHCDIQHQNEVFRCTKCSFEGSCFAKLQTHEYRWKHYPDDHDQDEPEPSAVKSNPTLNSLLIKQSIDKFESIIKQKKRDANKLRKNLNAVDDEGNLDGTLNVAKIAKRKLSFNDTHDEIDEMCPFDQSGASTDHVTKNKKVSLFTNNNLSALEEVDEEENVKSPEKPIISEPPGPDPGAGPALRVTCPVAVCQYSVPVLQGASAQPAQEMLYNHQRLAHGFTDAQLSAQLWVDRNEEDDEDSTPVPSRDEEEEEALNLCLTLSPEIQI